MKNFFPKHPLILKEPHLKRTHQVLVHGHHAAGVVKLAAVVGRGKERHERPLRKELVPVLDDLVRPADQIQVVHPQELGHDVDAEREADAAVVLAPALKESY